MHKGKGDALTFFKIISKKKLLQNVDDSYVLKVSMSCKLA